MKYLFATKIVAMMMLVMALITPGQVDAKDISQNELQQLMSSNQPIVLLDVRTVEEFAQGHIPNAINIPHKVLAARLAELSGEQNSQIVIYCRSGRRAIIARDILVKNGFKQLDHLSGDFNAWTDNNLPSTQSNEATK